MPIYTKKGDRGETGLFDGRRVAKNDALIEAIGSVDELNATLGLIKNKKLEKIQNELFSIGAVLAGTELKIDLEKRVMEIEQEIDRMWKEMPPLKNFILPFGQTHVARTVCRRAERAVVRAKAKFCWQYLNRLSDYLFCLARYENFKNKKAEVIWNG